MTVGSKKDPRRILCLGCSEPPLGIGWYTKKATIDLYKSLVVWSWDLLVGQWIWECPIFNLQRLILLETTGWLAETWQSASVFVGTLTLRLYP